MVAEARRFMHLSSWMILWPSLAVALVAIGFNLLGDGLRDALNPRTLSRWCTILDIAGLRRCDYATPAGFTRALDDVEPAASPRARCSGLVGESGSGKTSLAWAIMRYLPATRPRARGRIRLAGQDLIDRDRGRDRRHPRPAHRHGLPGSRAPRSTRRCRWASSWPKCCMRHRGLTPEAGLGRGRGDARRRSV